MRHIFIIVCILFSFSSADDIQRVKSIVKDIAKLRTNYDNIKKELESCKIKLKEQKIINDKLEFQIKQNKKYKIFKASSFRLNKRSSIYDGVNAKELFKWDEGTSFTSNKKSNGWIKITGYFVNKIWQKAPKELWIKEIDTMLRK